jgi:hypothetical protein
VLADAPTLEGTDFTNPDQVYAYVAGVNSNAAYYAYDKAYCDFMNLSRKLLGAAGDLLKSASDVEYNISPIIGGTTDFEGKSLEEVKDYLGRFSWLGKTLGRAGFLVDIAGLFVDLGRAHSLQEVVNAGMHFAVPLVVGLVVSIATDDPALGKLAAAATATVETAASSESKHDWEGESEAWESSVGLDYQGKPVSPGPPAGSIFYNPSAAAPLAAG